MRLPYKVLPSVVVPESVLVDIAAYDIEADKPWTEVVNIPAPSDYDSRPSKTLSPRLQEFLQEVCDAANPYARVPREDCLLIYGNVGRHNDTGFYAGRHPAVFLHVVLKGCGTLRFPGLRNKTKRALDMVPGLVFWMDATIHHEVRNAAAYGIASLCATVAFAN